MYPNIYVLDYLNITYIILSDVYTNVNSTFIMGILQIFLIFILDLHSLAISYIL